MPSNLARGFDPVTYVVSQQRLRRVVRPGLRKTLGRIWWSYWAWLALFCAFLLTVAVTPEVLYRPLIPVAQALRISLGVAINAVVWGAIAIFVVGLLLLSRIARHDMQARLEAAREIHLKPVDGGLRLSTAMIDYIVKWPGIYEVQRARDGIVLVHGGTLFFFIPDEAFTSPANRVAFLDYLERGLTPEALTRSAKELARARQA